MCCIQVSPLLKPLYVCEILKLSLISKFTNDSIYHKIYAFKHNINIIPGSAQFQNKKKYLQQLAVVWTRKIIYFNVFNSLREFMDILKIEYECDHHLFCFVCLFVLFCAFVLILYAPVNIFPVMSGRVFLVWAISKQRIKCFAQWHSTVIPLPCRHITFKQRRINVNTSIWRCFDVLCLLGGGETLELATTRSPV